MSFAGHSDHRPGASARAGPARACGPLPQSASSPVMRWVRSSTPNWRLARPRERRIQERRQWPRSAVLVEWSRAEQVAPPGDGRATLWLLRAGGVGCLTGSAWFVGGVRLFPPSHRRSLRAGCFWSRNWDVGVDPCRARLRLRLTSGRSCQLSREEDCGAVHRQQSPWECPSSLPTCSGDSISPATIQSLLQRNGEWPRLIEVVPSV